MGAPETFVQQIVDQTQNFLDLKRPKDAERALREALKQSPESAVLHASLARVLNYDERLNEALPAAEKAIALDPNDEWFYRIYSTILLNTDDARFRARAKEAAETALRLDPQSLQGHLCLFNVYVAMQVYDEAEKLSEKMLAISPDSADAFYSLARLAWMERGSNPLKVKKFLTETLKLNPRHAHAHFLLGQVLRQLSVERYAEGSAELRAAVELDPGNRPFRIAYRQASVVDASVTYGSQAIQDYGRPVQFQALPWGGKKTRVRKRFADFSMKFVESRETKIPFCGRKLTAYDFRIDAPDQKFLFTWRGGMRTPGYARPLEIKGRGFSVELEKSRLFEELGQLLMVVGDSPAPPDPGLWILFSAAPWAPQDLEKCLTGIGGSIELRRDSLEILDGDQNLWMHWPAEDGFAKLSPDEEKILSEAERLLGDRIRGRWIECHFTGIDLAQRALTVLAQRSPLVRLDAGAYRLSAPPELQIFGEPAPSSALPSEALLQSKQQWQKYLAQFNANAGTVEAPAQETDFALLQQWELKLPHAKTGTGSWTVLFGDVVTIETWLKFARGVNAVILNEKLGESRIEIMGQTLKAKISRDDPRIFAPSFEQLSGKKLRCAWQWEFNSLPLAMAVIGTVRERWPTAIWHNRKFYDPAALFAKPGRGGELELGNSGTELPPDAPRPQVETLSFDVLLSEAWDTKAWQKFVNEHEGLVNHFSNEGRTADWFEGTSHLHAQVDTFVHGLGGSKDISKNAAAVLGSEPKGYLNLVSNDPAWAARLLGWVSEIYRTAVMKKSPYGHCTDTASVLADLKSRLPTV